MAEEPKLISGRYQLGKKLGQGGMGEVYLATETGLDRLVALKFIQGSVSDTRAFGELLKRFRREAKALASLKHPNIVIIHTIGEHEGRPYLVMEYMEGGSLQSRIGKPMDWEEALRLLLPVGQALAYAHSKLILHRDIKPGNILLDENGQPKVADFGLVKLLEAESDGSRGDSTGSLSLAGMAAFVAALADLLAGKGLKQAGQPKKPGESDQAGHDQSAGKTDQPVGPKAPDGKDQAGHGQSTGKTDQPVGPKAPDGKDQAGHDQSAGKADLATGKKSPIRRQPLTAANAARAAALSRWGKGTLHDLAVSPDGKLIALAAFLGVYLCDATTLQDVRWIETNSEVRSVAFSPDGSVLAAGRTFDSLQLWRTANGELLGELQGHTGAVRGLNFSPDGSLLASGSADGTIRLWGLPPD
jgi:hypothetical protein